MSGKFHTVNQSIYGGTGGSGGKGGVEGGNGGTGEGPKMHYDVQAEQFIVNNHGIQQMDSVERKQIIEWLSPINFFLRQADISQARQGGTGGWLLVNPHFQEWESGSGRTLWCHGIPGAGKTVLASMIVDHLSPKSQNGNLGVACIYLNHKEAEDHTPTRLLSSLWRQLVLGKDLGPLPKKLYQQHQEKQTPLSLDEIFEVLCSAITEFLKVYIVVDAVDEYPETQRQILLEYLAEMGPTVNLLITSRPHITPDSALPNPATLEIRANEDDVGRYVDAQIRRSPRLSKHVQSRINLREEIHSAITCTVDGMFLLAKLHIESLSTKSTVKGVREALKTLPKTLNNSYNDAMKRIGDQNEESRGIAHSTLTWVANAKRPLTVLDIQTALAVEPGTKSLDEDNILDMEIILSVCAGLVIVDEQLLVVRLVHYTTQEYLDSIQPQQFPDAHTQITRTLLTYLAFDKIMDFTSHDFSPLFEYSQYCLAHAAGPPEGALKDLLLDFLSQAAKLRWKWLGTWKSPPWTFSDWPRQPSALWIAAAADLMEMVQFLLERVPYLPDPECPEIIVASNYGHLQMTQLLVEHGANVNVQGRYFGSALQAASYNGHENIVQLLIEHGANVNAQGGYYGSTLQTASLKGHGNIVQLLIEHGVNVNAQGGHFGSALQAASYNGNENIIHLLIEQGANVNVQGGDFGSALQAASFNGHINIVQLLIEHGANVNAQGGEYDSALQAASAKGHVTIVQLLIEHGANVNAQGGEYDSALQAASFEGHGNIVQLLIEQGADVNVMSGLHGSALQVASKSGHINIIQLLIEHGADVNAQGGEYGSALQAASLEGHRNIVQLLIEQGANVNVQGGEYGTALQAASFEAHGNIVQLLIEQGANIDAKGGEYGSALQAASLEGYENIVQLLIEHGANVNVQGGYLGSALQAASYKGHENIVHLLIEQGANVKAQGGKYGSALKVALQSDLRQAMTYDARPYNERLQSLDNVVQILRDNGAEEPDDEQAAVCE
ncbi:ankyrin repeat domain-containing protein [Mycena alexandri]|uniref:Ankyrin repeat domain-containing protein n=1 Tax=Mycena alexandri TaxID=1745969 RepID=A0AAD6WXB8_9AGAR|nr:ankyrin repeat domain-containing protein [Mycena alexandri]